MTYSNHFVVSILVDGQFLKELPDGTTSIPFGSTYTVRLKNKNYKRAKASLYIDEIHQGDFVVSGNSSVDIERPADIDRAFVFVRPTSQEAKAQGKDKLLTGTKGVIRVKWFLEQERQTYIPYIPPYPKKVRPIEDNPWDTPWKPTYPSRPYPSYPQVWFGSTESPIYGCSNNAGSAEYGALGHTTNGSSSCSSPLRGIQAQSTPLEEGVTVKGEITNQQFTQVYLDWETDFVEMKLVLKGFDGPPKKELRYCSNCGSERNKKHRFCGFCSQKF